MLLLGIALSLLGVTSTGILMDQGKALGRASLVSSPADVAPPLSGPNDRAWSSHRDDDEDEERGAGEDEGPLAEVHELFANLLIAIVALQVSDLILVKWPLARFMLFLRQPQRKSGPGASA